MNNEQLVMYMKNEVTMEKECDIEYEVGCGIINIESWAHFHALMFLVVAKFTDVDANASEMNDDGTGFIWVC